ncbi:MAG: hypothetical protein NTW54_00370 [Bacteroidetes bacterium]|nr:hypothetical protein [Bacteroidota bacterium]
MVPKIKHHAVNWIDGMKISKSHFAETNNFIYDQIRDGISLQLTNFNYGLLPPLSGEKTSLTFTVKETQSEKYKVSLSHCRAITHGGCRIEVLEGGEEISSTIEVAADIAKKGTGIFDVVLTVNPFVRVPAGTPNAEEQPPRHPFEKPLIEISVVPTEQIKATELGEHFIIIGRLHYKSNEFVFDQRFIPACTSIIAHPALKTIYNTLGGYLNSIQSYSTNIVKKVLDNSQDAGVALNVRLVCERLVYYTSASFFSFRSMLPQQSPIYVVEMFSRLANEAKVGINCLKEKDREELLNYFKEWTDLTPGQFMGMLDEVIDIEYDHNDCYDALAKVDYMLSILASLLDKLNALELIGRKKERDIFVREKEIDKKPEKKKGFSMLDF